MCSTHTCSPVLLLIAVLSTVATSIKLSTKMLPTLTRSNGVQSAVHSSASSMYLAAATRRACKSRYPKRVKKPCSPDFGLLGTWILFFLHICALYSLSTPLPTARRPRAVFMPSVIPPLPYKRMSSRIAIRESRSAFTSDRNGPRRIDSLVATFEVIKDGNQLGMMD